MNFGAADVALITLKYIGLMNTLKTWHVPTNTHTPPTLRPELYFQQIDVIEDTGRLHL